MATKKSKNSDSLPVRLEEIMKTHGLSKADFARALEVSNAHVANWLSGQLPRADQLLTISKKYDITMEWLLTGQGFRTIEEIIVGSEGFQGEPLSPESRKRTRMVLEKRDAAFAPDVFAERANAAESKLENAAKCAEALATKLREAEAELTKLRGFLA